jgi:hypothetical protein
VTYTGGVFTFTPEPDTVDALASFQYSITDADGDTSTATVWLDVAGDTKPVADAETANVDDDGLDVPNTQQDAGTGDDVTGQTPESVWAGTFTATVGADTPPSDFNFASMNTGPVTDVIGQETVTYSWDNDTDTLTAQITDTPDASRMNTTLFTVEITDRLAGDYTVTLAQNVLHDTLDDEIGDDTENNVATTNLQFTALDSDGSPDSAALTIDFDDDVPEEVTPDAASMINQAGASDIGVALDDDNNIDDDVGADQVGTLGFGFAGDGSVIATNTNDDPLTTGNPAQSIYLYVDGNVLVGSTVQGPDDFATVLANTDAKIFTLTLHPDGTTEATDNYDFVLHQPINGEVSFNSGDASYVFQGGNDPYGYFKTLSDNPDILLTPIENDALSGSINESANTVGVADGQSVGGLEAIRVDFLQDIIVADSDPSATDGGAGYASLLNQDHTFGREGEIPAGDAHQMVNGAEATFAKLSGTTTSEIKAYDSLESDANAAFGDQLHFNTDDRLQTIDAIVITDGGAPVTVLRSDPSTAPAGYAVTFNLATVTISGITQGATIGVIVGADAAVPQFDSVEYHWVSGSTFKLGDFGALYPSSAGKVDFDFDLTLTDADGDTVALPDAIEINLAADSSPVPAPAPASAAVAESLSTVVEEEALVEDSQAAVQTATDGVDILVGTDGDDAFAWTLADNTEAGDTVTNFEAANDAIDIKDLLADGVDTSDFSSYLNVEVNESGDTVIKVNSDGDWKGNPSDDLGATDQVITLEGVDLMADFGNDVNAALQSMVDAGKLITD